MSRLVVLFSTGPLKASDNPYLQELVGHLGPEVDVRFLTPRSVLGRVDVFHVHWPHQLVHGAGRLRTVVKLLTSAWLLTRLSLRRTPVVWTVHNLTSHEQGNVFEQWVTGWLERHVSLRIYLNEAPRRDQGLTALHPHYREWQARFPPAPEPLASGRFLLFGMLRPYKGLEELISAAGEAGVATTIAGAPQDEEYGDRLAARVAGTESVTLISRSVEEPALLALLRAHDVVVLPYLRMYNSGALIYALSAGVPVLAPHSPANEALQREVGDPWLRLYRGTLSAGELVSVTEAPAGEPDLSRRDPAEHAALHIAAYRRLAGRGE